MVATGIRRVAPTLVAALALAILAVGCGSQDATPRQAAGQTGAHQVAGRANGAPVVVAAGDIASCESEGDEATAKLLARIEGTVVALGDEAYESGSAKEFRQCYDPSWGKYKSRTYPTPGNHEYDTEGAEGYFGYFGEQAGDPKKGYYSFDLGQWHLISLNSNCEEVGGCEASSPQVRWLKADLAANKQKLCTLAYMHHPRFSSGEEHGSTPKVEPLWEALYEAGAEVVLSGHEHNYERFGPQDAEGRADPEGGIREIVVGTGGKSHYPIVNTIANSEVHNDHTYGVLRVSLRSEGYEWRFVPAAGGSFTDSGSARCH
jgi:acid phosphatase type 7